MIPSVSQPFKTYCVLKALRSSESPGHIYGIAAILHSHHVIVSGLSLNRFLTDISVYLNLCYGKPLYEQEKYQASVFQLLHDDFGTGKKAPGVRETNTHLAYLQSDSSF